MAAFESALAEAGFALAESWWPECTHAPATEWRCYYQSTGDCSDECRTILSKHVPWQKNVGCGDCIADGLRSLLHGGFYENIRIVEINPAGAERNREDEFGVTFHDLDPEARFCGFCAEEEDCDERAKSETATP